MWGSWAMESWGTTLSQSQLPYFPQHFVLFPLKPGTKLNLLSLWCFPQAAKHSNGKSGQYCQKQWMGKDISFQYEVFYHWHSISNLLLNYALVVYHWLKSIKMPSLLFFLNFLFLFLISFPESRRRQHNKRFVYKIWKKKRKTLLWWQLKVLPGRLGLMVQDEEQLCGWEKLLQRRQ